MKSKHKIKKELKTVSVYLPIEEYELLVNITNKHKISLTEWLRDSMKLKLNNENENAKTISKT